jgi:hypothetical protein
MQSNQSIHITIKQPGLAKDEPIRQLAVFPQIPSDTKKFAQYIAHVICKELHCEASPSFQEALRKEAIEAIQRNDILVIQREGSFLQITLSCNDPISKDS